MMVTTVSEIKIDTDPSDDEAHCYVLRKAENGLVRIESIYDSEMGMDIEPAVLREIVRVLPELESEVLPVADQEVPF